MHGVVNLPGPNPGRIDPRSTVYGEVQRTPSRATTELGRRRCIAATPRAQLTLAARFEINT
jgi:hypothetical protein